MGPFQTFLVLELQRGYLYQNGVEFRQKVIGASLNLFWGLLLRGYTNLSLAVGHVRECPHNGTCYSVFVFIFFIGVVGRFGLVWFGLVRFGLRRSLIFI